MRDTIFSPLRAITRNFIPMPNPYSQGASTHGATVHSARSNTVGNQESTPIHAQPQTPPSITNMHPTIPNPYKASRAVTPSPPCQRLRRRFRRRQGPPRQPRPNPPARPEFPTKDDHPPVRLISEVSIQNLKQNTDFGDVLQQLLQADDLGLMLQYIATDADQADAPEHWKNQVLRVYFQNVNGLRQGDGGADIVHVLLQMYNIGAGIFAFNETKANCMDPKIQRLFEVCKRKIWDRKNEQCKIYTCSSDLPWASNSKPGGIMLGFTGPLVGRTKKHYKDKYGRWLRVDLLGRNGKTLSVICAYQVSQDVGTHGNTTTYQQRVILMRMDGMDAPNPKKSFITDLSTLVKQLRKNKHDVILMGDFNESIGIKPEMMASVLLAGDLTDTYTYLHGIETERPTYARGTKRIDYIFVSPRLLKHLKRAGAEPFNFRIYSDHRGLWVDLSLPGVFDRAPNALAKPNARPFVYDAPNHVKQYLDKTNRYFIQHDILHRLRELLETDERDDAIAEGLDEDITRAMLSAADSMKSTTREPWSEDLHNAMTTLYILLKQLSQIRTDIDMSKAIDTMQLKLPQPIALPTSLAKINQAVRAARRAVRLVVRQASDLAKLREKDKIKARQLAQPDVDPEKVEQQYFQAQVSRELFRAVPSAKPHVSGGISTVEVPINPGDDPKGKDTLFRSIREPNEVEATIIIRNEKHFGQAAEAPLAHPSVTAKLSFCGTTSIADQLLAGTADIDAITPDKFGRALLRYCTRQLPEAPPDISLETLRSAYRHWPVGTSTSPSGRTLSHQHLLFQPHGVATDHPDHGHLEESREANWEAQAGIVQYATKHGYCFKRWCQVVNAMLEKEQGNPKLHRLRVIHLYESDYNAVLGIKLREVMHQCEDHEKLHMGAYGSRANRQSLDPVFIEVLQYDYASLTRWPEIKFGNDTSSCYDRHLPSVSNIILRSLGLHRNIADVHGSMLENAVYRIKTQLGISTMSYSHSLTSPVFGTGQGSKASPPVWATLCSALFNIYDEACWGAHYYDLTGRTHLKLGMTGFVDDNACNVNCRPHEVESLVQRATHDSQLWNDILWGGSQILEPPKCCFHRNETEFTSSGAPLFRIGQFGDPIIIVDSKGNRVKLKQLSAYMPYKTLGTWQSVGKRQKIQFDVLKEKSTKLSRVLALSSCSGNAAWLYFSSIFQKGVGYPLAVSRLTQDQLHSLEGPMISLTLNRMRYIKRLSRALVHGPRRYGGLEFHSFATMQGSKQLMLLLRHLRCPGQPHDLALIVIDRLQYISGVGYHIFENTKARLPHLEGVWLPTVYSFLRRIQGSLQITGLTIQPLMRQGDRYLMDMVLAAGGFRDVEIQRLNYCRLYLQVITLSDICNAKGTQLEVGIARGHVAASQSTSTLLEPLQERPEDSVWGLWRRFLRTFSDKNGTLTTALGPWPNVIPHRRRFPSLYSRQNHVLYRRGTNDYSEHRPVRTRIFAYDIDDTTTHVPVDSIPVDLRDFTDGWQITIPTQSQPTTIPAIFGPTFCEHLEALPDHQRLLLERVDLLGHNIFDLCNILKQLDDIIVVSDGGAMSEFGSFGWVISSTDGTRLARGSGTVFGFDPRSYRAEGYGAKASTLFILQVLSYCGQKMPNGTFTFYCDNKGVLSKLRHLRSYSQAIYATCLHSEWDIISSVHRLHQEFSELPELDHVKGHQDSSTMKCMLPLPAQLNIEADELATAEMMERGSIKSIVPFDPSVGVMLQIQGRSVTRNLETSIRQHLHIAPIRRYYRDRFLWSVDTLDAIDWETFSVVYTKYARTRTFFTKFGWKKLPVGNRLHERSPSYDHRCPCCHHDHEQDDHVFQCTTAFHEDWQFSLFTRITDKVGQFLDPDLLAILRIGLTSYFRGIPVDFSERFPLGYSSTPYKQLIAEQSAIGWDHFFRGKVSGQWQQLQYYYAKCYGLISDSEGWLVSLVRLLSVSAFSLWDFRNGCRHGRDSATKFVKTYEQAQREVRELYLKRDLVLEQDKNLFWDSVNLHVKEPYSVLANWLQINRKFITFSARQAKAKAQKNTDKLPTFFNVVRRSVSRLKTPSHGASKTTYTVSKSRRRKEAPPPPKSKYFNTYLTRHFTALSPSRSVLPVIVEEPLSLSSPHTVSRAANITRDSPRPKPRQRCLYHFFPDHPG